MIKNIAWNTFKNTGNIDTFLEFKQLENIEETQNIMTIKKVEQDGNNKNEWNNNFGK